MKLFDNLNIDFIGKRKITFIISIVIILAGIFSLIVNGGPKYGIDFTGGTLLELDFQPNDENTKPIEIQQIRDILATQGFGDAEIQEFGNPNNILVTIKSGIEIKAQKSRLIKILQEKFPEYAGNKDVSRFVRRSEHVGAKIGEEANKLILQADKFFDNKEYLRAKEIYTKAYQIDPIDTIQEKINNAISWHRITTEPEKYALDIIKNFENGIIPLKISKLEDELYKKFFRKQIKIYGWQTFRSPKFNSYEVRYSIITPEKSYFFLWVVKLESEQIIPLHKTTENLL